YVSFCPHCLPSIQVRQGLCTQLSIHILSLRLSLFLDGRWVGCIRHPPEVPHTVFRLREAPLSQLGYQYMGSSRSILSCVLPCPVSLPACPYQKQIFRRPCPLFLPAIQADRLPEWS